jgi:hypothetical protein
MTNADEYNADLAKRQAQINEWTYNNRMETLFVFQVVFISLMMVAIVAYLKKMGLVGGAFFIYFIILLSLLTIVIVLNRVLYTRNKRDSHVWGKRRFKGDNTYDSPLSPRDDAWWTAYGDQFAAFFKNKCVGCNK